MARKQLVASTNAAGGWAGPYVDGNDNVYVVLHAPSGGTVRIWKAGTDPLVDAWSEQDGAGRPTTADAGNAFASWQEGTKIHFIGWSTSLPIYEYSVFGTSDDASADQWDATIIDEVVEAPANAPLIPGCFIAVRSNGDVVVLYSGDTDKEMGTDYDRTDYAIRPNSSGTWDTVGANVAGAGLEDDGVAVGSGRGASDTIWFHYHYGTTVRFRDLPTSDTLGTELDGTISIGNPSPHLGYYDDDGVEVVTAAGIGNFEMQQIRGGTVQTKTTVSGVDVDNTDVCIAVNGRDAYVVYRSATPNDVTYQKSRDEGAWGDITTISAATAPILISANVINHGGGNVIAVVYRDTNLYYDEYALKIPNYPTRQITRFNHFLRR